MAEAFDKLYTYITQFPFVRYALIVGVLIALCSSLLDVTFDEDFAKGTGVKASEYNLILAVVIAVIIVLAMNLVGSLLISALVIFPALSAMRVFKSFKSVTVCSGVLSVICTLLGICISIVYETPVGSTIVAVDLAAFGIFMMIGKFSGRVKA